MTAVQPRMTIRSPFDGSAVGDVALSGRAEVDDACVTAGGMLDSVLSQEVPQYRRAEILDRAAVLLADSRARFAELITREVGKPAALAAVEVDRCLETLRFSAAEARKLTGEAISAEATPAGVGATAMTLRVPLGVVGAITPFNFPLNLVAHKVAPAIAAGCPVVLKPAPQAPLTALAFAELLGAAGLPAGYLSVVADAGSEAGAALVANEIPRMLSFTGSVKVGWAIAEKAFRKKVALELGSASSTLVAPDADLSHAADRVVAGGFAFAGQSCVAVQNVYVQRSRHAEFVKLLEDRIAKLAVGDPLDPRTQVGPLIDTSACERIRGWVTDAVDHGARLIAGGELQGAMMAPTLVDSPPSDSSLVTEEVFGPVVSVLPVDDLDHAVRALNQLSFTLQVGIFSNDLSAVLGWISQIRAGGIIVNDVPTTRLDHQPYGGVGDAGNTKEGPAYTVREMTELKFVSMRPSPQTPVQPA